MVTPLDLSIAFQVPIKFLYLISNHTPDFYHIYKIPKKNGKSRTIEAPLPVLKYIQRKILHRFLEQLPPIGWKQLRVATAFERGCSIRKNAARHCGQPVILSLDVKDFFPSLRYQAVRNMFASKYPWETAGILAKLCTLYGHLPQGAVTSPHISNLLLRRFDQTLLEYCKKRYVVVSRYADDLTFSGAMDNETITELIQFCRQELRYVGLKLNNQKIHVQRKSGCQSVTGLVVNETVNAPRDMRRAVRQKMYYLNKFWEKEWRKLDDHTLNVLLGQVNFIWDLKRENREFSEYRRQLLEIQHFRNL